MVFKVEATSLLFLYVIQTNTFTRVFTLNYFRKPSRVPKTTCTQPIPTVLITNLTQRQLN